MLLKFFLGTILTAVTAYATFAWWQCRCWKYHGCRRNPTRGNITFTTPTDL